MLWLVPALLGSLLGLWFTWSRGLHVPAAVLLVAVFALVFVIGRRIESGRDADWQQAAQRVQGRFVRGCELAAFGPAPWTAWAADGELQCPRAIEGRDAQPPFALLQVRYSVRQRRGEEQPDAWYEVSVAAVTIPGDASAHALAPFDAGEHAGASNGRTLFLWAKRSRGAGASLPADALPALLQQARARLTQRPGAAAAGASAGPAGPAPAVPRTPP